MNYLESLQLRCVRYWKILINGKFLSKSEMTVKLYYLLYMKRKYSVNAVLCA